jgi:hypothetical protein
MDDQTKDSQHELKASQFAGRFFSFVGFLLLWVVSALLLGFIGGTIVGLKGGGWGWQFLPLLGGAILGGPLVGIVSTVLFVVRGKDYWTSLWYATAVVTILSPMVSAFYYLFFGSI